MAMPIGELSAVLGSEPCIAYSNYSSHAELYRAFKQELSWSQRPD